MYFDFPIRLRLGLINSGLSCPLNTGKAYAMRIVRPSNFDSRLFLRKRYAFARRSKWRQQSVLKRNNGYQESINHVANGIGFIVGRYKKTSLKRVVSDETRKRSMCRRRFRPGAVLRERSVHRSLRQESRTCRVVSDRQLLSC